MLSLYGAERLSAAQLQRFNARIARALSSWA